MRQCRTKGPWDKVGLADLISARLTFDGTFLATTRCAAWGGHGLLVAVKGLKLSYHLQETTLFTLFVYIYVFIPVILVT